MRVSPNSPIFDQIRLRARAGSALEFATLLAPLPFSIDPVWPSRTGFAGAQVEIGAAWAKRSSEGRDYLGLKLDDPSFTAPIYANLFDDEDGEGHSLIWSRPNGCRNGD